MRKNIKIIFEVLILLIIEILIVFLIIFSLLSYLMSRYDENTYINELHINKDKYEMFVNSGRDIVENVDSVCIEQWSIIPPGRDDIKSIGGLRILPTGKGTDKFDVKVFYEMCGKNAKQILNRPRLKKSYWERIFFRSNGVVFIANDMRWHVTEGLLYSYDGELLEGVEDCKMYNIEGDWYWISNIKE